MNITKPWWAVPGNFRQPRHDYNKIPTTYCRQSVGITSGLSDEVGITLENCRILVRRFLVISLCRNLIFTIDFSGENFSFHKNISTKIFFTIFSSISFVFDVCGIMYFAKSFIRNFAHCEFFFLQFWCTGKNCKFFLQFFFQRWTWILNLKRFLFWKKVKIFLIVLLDFFTHY